MQGYWNLPEQTAKAFLKDPAGARWYRTGDIAVNEDAENYTFIGRKDRMVKRRGYRVELGEIESALYRHPVVREAAAIALEEADGVKIKIFLGCRDGKRPSIIELKRFCVEQLPGYMIPDVFVLTESLPKTSTAKIDYQLLKGMN